MKYPIKIESLKKKGKNKYLVTTANEVLTVSEDDVVKYRILKGSTFTKEEWEAIKKGKAQADAWEKVLNYLSYQERSEKDIKIYLQKLSINENEIEDIVLRLQSLDFINDKRYANNFVNSYKKSNKGPNFIMEKLKQKGVSDELISNALKRYAPEEEREAIKRIIQKNQSLKSTYPIKKQKQLIYDKLIRDGFSPELVINALYTTEFNSNHYQRLEQDFEKLVKKENNEARIITKLMQKGYEYIEIKKLLDEFTSK